MLPNIDNLVFEAQSSAELDRQGDIILARKYHEGDQEVYLTDRARQYLGLHAENTFRLNICRPVVSAVLAELHLIGFDAGEQGDSQPQAEFATSVMTANRADQLQKDVHECTLRDSEAFVIVDWDASNSRPRLTWLPRYTSLEADGDEMGCYMVYPDDDYTQPALYAIKRWVETTASGTRMRATVYYPGKIERYVYGRGWEPYVDNVGDEWPTPWVDAAGLPLGIPVVHFRNAGLRPEAWDAIPMQDAVNKLLLDILGAADLSGFRVLFAKGFIPTSDGQPLAADGSNVAQIQPGSLLGTTNESADLKSINGEDPTPLVNTMTQLIQHTAHITDTPPGRFSASAQVQSGDSQKEQNKPFYAKVDDRRVRFGNSWEDVMGMARRLANLFGSTTLDESVPFSAIWKHSFTYDDLKAKKEFGVPKEKLWSEMGYSPREIASMKQMDEYKNMQAATQALTAFGNGTA